MRNRVKTGEERLASLETTRTVVITIVGVFGITGAWLGNRLRDAENRVTALERAIATQESHLQEATAFAVNTVDTAASERVKAYLDHEDAGLIRDKDLVLLRMKRTGRILGADDGNSVLDTGKSPRWFGPDEQIIIERKTSQ